MRLGIFTATFVYAIAALTGVDRSGSGRVPYLSILLVFALVLASVGMFIALINRIGVLQIDGELVFTGDQGRKVIAASVPRPLSSGTSATWSGAVPALSRAQTLVYDGAASLAPGDSMSAYWSIWASCPAESFK